MTWRRPACFCPNMPATLGAESECENRPARLPSVGEPMKLTAGWLRGWLAPALAALAVRGRAAGHPAQTAVPFRNHPERRSVRAARRDARTCRTCAETLRDPAKRDEFAKQIETMLQVQQAAAAPEQGIGAAC